MIRRAIGTLCAIKALMPALALAQFINFLGIDVASGGALTKISALTASSSANLSFTGLGSTYNTLILDCNDMLPSGTNVDLQLLFGEGAGPTYEVTNYYGGLSWVSSLPGSGVNGMTNAAAISLTTPSSQMDGVGVPTHIANTHIFVSRVASTSHAKVATYATGYASGDGVSVVGSAGYYGDTNAITALRIQFSSGNITSGTCTLYGLTP